MRKLAVYLVISGLSVFVFLGIFIYKSTSSGDTYSSDSPPVVSPVGVGSNTPVYIPQARPEWMAIPGVLGKTSFNPQGIVPVNGVVKPTDDRPVFRTDSNEPGTDSPGVTILYGHNYTSDSGLFVPFSALEEVNVGDVIKIGTRNGVLTYKIRQSFTVPKSQLAQRDDIFENVPNRLVLITCDTNDGHDTYDNRIVVAHLSMG